MATTSTKKTTTGSKTKAKAAQTETVNADINVANDASDKVNTSSVKITDVDPHQIIVVRNGFQGTLVYKSRRTGEKFIWSGFGDEQEMELGELRNAKSSSKDFFIKNWFMFDDEYKWVISYLGLGNYYKYSIGIDDFDELFDSDPDTIIEKISKLSNGQKQSVGYRARQLVSEGKIDSNKVIRALESALNTQLVEK